MAFSGLLGKLLSAKPAEQRFEAASLSACGLVRRQNQDNLLSLPQAGFFCVADGMGGGMGGEIASRIICDECAAAAKPAAFLTLPGEKRKEAVEAALQSANAKIREYADGHGFRSMGSTVAAALSDPSAPGRLLLAHAGDSRIYRLRRGDLSLLTKDHTVGMELGGRVAVRAGETRPSDRKSPLAHILTRAIGIEYRARMEWGETDAKPGDRFLICSDGVHDMLADGDIREAMLGRRSPGEIARRLETGIIAAGAGDN